LCEPRANDAALLGVFLQPGANALDVATNVKKTLPTLATRLPMTLYEEVHQQRLLGNPKVHRQFLLRVVAVAARTL